MEEGSRRRKINRCDSFFVQMRAVKIGIKGFVPG
jgi:hypothetical protein